MSSPRIGPFKLSATIEQWPLAAPFRISGYTFEAVDVLVVRLEQDGCIGQGEAAGVYYLNDTPTSILQQVRSVQATLEAGVSRESIQHFLPRGGARNALDCALWELEAKLQGSTVWQIAGLAPPRPLLTTFTCSADSPRLMADRARGYAGARAIKLKLTGEPVDVDRIRAVREAAPDVWLAVDANQGFSRSFLEQLLPVMLEARVELIEQPFRIGEEALLEGLRSPIPIAADESMQGLADLPALVGRFDMVNIKLDKCGGLTEGLAIAHAARELRLDCMVGNMISSSLAMAPAFLVGQLCKVVDLDGPLFLREDRAIALEYRDGFVACPRELWG